MKRIQSFTFALQTSIHPEDARWNYTIPNMPDSRNMDAARLVKMVQFESSPGKQLVQLRVSGDPGNRVTSSLPLHHFLMCSFGSFRLQQATDPEGNSKPAPARESADYILRVLQTGIIINGVAYRFLGHSNSQLKSRSCFCIDLEKTEISRMIESMGDFKQIKSVSKKAKRIGLLFSTTKLGIMLKPENCRDIPDVKRDEYIFTDGCGFISKRMATEVARRCDIVYRNMRYLPAVFQIRYRGYKGVLTLDHSLKGDIHAEFRDSMKKFKDAKDLNLFVVDYSKPYSFGYLNDEIVMLLHALGISADILLCKQTEHVKVVQQAELGDMQSILQFLSYRNQFELTEKLLLEGLESVQSSVRGLINDEYSRFMNKYDEERCRIMIFKSRLLFGVCDPTAKEGKMGVLKEGECFVRVTDNDGVRRTIIGTEVLVTRNPCLHPGDLQKFKTVNLPDYDYLGDCIVFSTRGKRPSPDLMSGGDLDGDKFFVTWDPDVIPSLLSEPAMYPGVKEPITFKPITDEDRAEYFARYTNSSLGRVKNLYMKWVRLEGPMSGECQELNRLFSQCVDGNKIRVPQHLEDPPHPSPEQMSILEILHDALQKSIESRVYDKGNWQSYSEEAMDLLLARDQMALPEFGLIQLTLHWCQKHGYSITHFLHYFNFSALTDEQKTWIVSQLPPSEDYSRLVRNGTLQSHLVSPNELRRFSLDRSELHWQPIFDSSKDRMGNFLGTLSRSLELFHKKLIIFRAHERLTIALYIPEKVERAVETSVDASVRVFAFPHSKGDESTDYRVMPTKKMYKLYCDESSLQLYQLKRSTTWIMLQRGGNDDSQYRNTKNTGERRRQKQATIDQVINYDCLASIDLNKIGKRIQTHVGRIKRESVTSAEIYVISNRDVASMRFLDCWLHYIDTEEVLPLFEKSEVEYTIPRLSDMIAEQLDPVVARILRDLDTSSVHTLQNCQQIRSLLEQVTKYGERYQLHQLYNKLLELELDPLCPLNKTELQKLLLESLSGAVYLLPLLLRSETWKTHKSELQLHFDGLVPVLLKKLVLNVSTMRDFIKEPMRMLLVETKLLSFEQLSEVIELISLTSQEFDTAMDLLLEVIQPEVSRLVIARPSAIDHFIKHTIATALDYVDGVLDGKKNTSMGLRLNLSKSKHGHPMAEAKIRIDSALNGLLRTGDHVKLEAASLPQNMPYGRAYVINAIVASCVTGSVTFRCLHHPPAFVAECAWNLTHYGPFVTKKAMFDAIANFHTEGLSTCQIYEEILGIHASPSPHPSISTAPLPFKHSPSLNTSQNRAVESAMQHTFSLLWGPPGTGKTHTIVVILKQLLNALPESRFLITAPTHNAVNNLLDRFIKENGQVGTNTEPIRVTSDLSKVAPHLRSYTCDAMVGKELAHNFKARRAAQERISAARLIFTTCVGAALGLLRAQIFQVVIVDEASQQTEAETLIPLVKGCQRAVLVGDHVQLRATVGSHATLTGFDISLFERLYTRASRKDERLVKVMLDTQYRMHKSVCEFSSAMFYKGKLKTAKRGEEKDKIAASRFPWPENGMRLVFIQCSGMEDLRKKSKTNQDQAKVCKDIWTLLHSAPTANGKTPKQAKSDDKEKKKEDDMVILTPYVGQRKLLQSLIPDASVSSIDGFQGQESDVVIFVTVRRNTHHTLGFLNDMRRLNVVMTRARKGVIIIGDRTTLCTRAGSLGGGGSMSEENEDDAESKRIWAALLGACVGITLPDM